MKSITLHSHAKVNIFLDVIGRRPDGYHEVQTVMQEIDLTDKMRISFRSTRSTLCSVPPERDQSASGRNPIPLRRDATATESPVSFSCQWASSGTGVPPVKNHGQDAHATPLPTGTDNIAYRAAEKVLHAPGAAGARALRGKELHIQILKRIPLASGMGGGSSNAAAVLIGLNRLLNLKLSPRQLNSLAAGLGSDVPFFLQGGTALCTGKGERVKPLSVAGTLHHVILVPPWGLSTPCVYEEYDRTVQESPLCPPASGGKPAFSASSPLAGRNRVAQTVSLRTREFADFGPAQSNRLRYVAGPGLGRSCSFASQPQSAAVAVVPADEGCPARLSVEPTARLRTFLHGLTSGNLEAVAHGMFNALEPPAFRVEPRMADLKMRMEKLDFLRVMMTGSGSAIFGLCRSASHAESCARRLRRLRLGAVFHSRSKEATPRRT